MRGMRPDPLPWIRPPPRLARRHCAESPPAPNPVQVAHVLAKGIECHLRPARLYVVDALPQALGLVRVAAGTARASGLTAGRTSARACATPPAGGAGRGRRRSARAGDPVHEACAGTGPFVPLRGVAGA